MKCECDGEFIVEGFTMCNNSDCQKITSFSEIISRAEKTETVINNVNFELRSVGYGKSIMPNLDVKDLVNKYTKAETELSLIKSRLQGITIDKLDNIIRCHISHWDTGGTEILATEIHKLISEVAK